MEQATILREVVEKAKSRNPFDSASYSACMYVKLIQELLGYVRDTCPDIHKPSKKLVATFIVLYPSTSASGSKPLGNTKNDRILQTLSSNEKNRVEVQSRKVISKLNKQNSNSKNVCNEHVKHLVKGAKALCSVCNECLFDTNHAMCLIDHVNSMNVCAKSTSKKNKKRKEWKPTGKVFNSVGYKWKPTGRTFTLVGNVCPLTRITTTNKVPLRVPIPLEVVAPKHVGSDTSVAPSSSSLIDCRLSKLFCDLEVAFQKHTCFVRNLEGVDLLLGSQGTNLYSLSIRDMMASSLICLLSKATKTKSWLWHCRLSHLNFSAINHLARHGLVCGLPRLKFEKANLCSACAIGKSKKQSHKPKSKDTNQEKLYLLHMDLCGPMHFASVNRKKYILIIVDDYSQFTWVKFLASKDEAPDFIIKFLKMIQVRLNATVRNIRIDNKTETRSKPSSFCTFVSPSRHEWDLVFQSVFDELFSPPASIASPILVEEAPAPVESTGSPSSTTIDQDAPSPNMEDDVPLTIEQYIDLIPDDIKPGIVNPKIGDDVEFEIKANFMRELRHKLFAGTDNKDAYEHVRTVLEIVDVFHFPGVTHDAIMLRVFPITLKGQALRWKDRRKLEEICNFKQERNETLYYAWERYNDLLYQCPLHDLNCQQKVHIFYTRLDISTNKILDSDGFIPLMTPTQALESMQVMANH
ncbi:retrovirus-related pol polyprotein from transposon TNT 1-94 [Tanacetum coccineum]|uniref:Retrovirus-related pol polyprotein from transposon TNT 1-94 n=1 Tax=Tanacetum coccineum TaxID=301880 RepID=A0ABQ5GZZ6_9ASTR